MARDRALGARMVPHAIGVLADEVTRMLAGLPGRRRGPLPGPRRRRDAPGCPRRCSRRPHPSAWRPAPPPSWRWRAQGVHVTAKTLALKPSRLSPRQGLARMLGTRAAWEALKALIKVVVDRRRGAGARAVAGRRSSCGPGCRRWRPHCARGLRAAPLVWTARGDRAAARPRGLRLPAPHGHEAAAHDSAGDQGRAAADRGRPDGQGGDPGAAAGHRAATGCSLPWRRRTSCSSTPPTSPWPCATRPAAARRASWPRAPARSPPRSGSRRASTGCRWSRTSPWRALLYRICDLDDEIPAELYMAVARILAFVFSLRRPGSGVPRPGPSDDSRTAGPPHEGAAAGPQIP